MEYMEDVAPETKANELATIFEGSRGHGGRQIHKIRGQEATADAEQAVNRNESASKLNFVHGCTHDLKQRAANKRMGGASTGAGIAIEVDPGTSGAFRVQKDTKKKKKIQKKEESWALKQKEWQTVTESVGIMKHDRTRKWSRLKFMTRCSCQKKQPSAACSLCRAR